MTAEAEPASRTATPAEIWPEHAGHTYSVGQRGWTYYELQSITITDVAGEPVAGDDNLGDEILDGDVDEQNYWCESCRVQLRFDDSPLSRRAEL